MITSVKVYVSNIDFLCLKLNQNILRAKNDILKSRRRQFQSFKTLRFFYVATKKSRKKINLESHHKTLNDMSVRKSTQRDERRLQ